MMRQYHFLKKFLILFVIGYISCCFLFITILHKKEVFPIFVWSLFSYTAAIETNDISLLVIEVDGQELSSPLSSKLMREKLSHRDARLIRRLIRRLGNAIIEDDSVEEEKMRRLLEPKIMNTLGKNIKYMIVKRTYNPVEMFKYGAYRSHVLKKYYSKKKDT